MTHEEVIRDLQEMIRTHFDDEEIVIKDATRATDVDGWDSLEHINLINMIEKRYSIRFKMSEAVAFRTIGDMVRCIVDKTA